jgi:Kef-type K+ transport system membrane component KefB
MWEMAKTSIFLFLRGKLFADPQKVLRQTAIGVAVAALLLIILAKLGLPLILAAAIAGILGGALQPYLFKDLRYR